MFQACRGEKLDAGIVLSRELNTEVDSSTASYKIPKHSDFLIFFSTYDGNFVTRTSMYIYIYIFLFMYYVCCCRLLFIQTSRRGNLVYSEFM